MEVTRNLDSHSWKRFVDQHPQGNIFHTPEMFEVFKRTRGYEPKLWAALGTDGEVLAIFLPVQISLLQGPLRAFTSRAVAFGSVVCLPDSRGHAALGMLLKSYTQEARNSPLFTELRNLADLQDTYSILHEHGFQYEDHLNFLIDLHRPLSDVWNEIRSNARRNIKKAQGSGVQIEELRSPEEIATAYDLLKKVYKRIQVPLPDISLFQSAFDVLSPKSMLKILLAKLQNETIGVLCLLLYNGVATYWYTGTLREYTSYRAGELLVWQAMELGKQQGCHTFDFGGGGKPDEEYGVRDFKAKFGGKLVNYGRNIYIHSPLLLKLSRLAYRVFRRIL